MWLGLDYCLSNVFSLYSSQTCHIFWSFCSTCSDTLPFIFSINNLHKGCMLSFPESIPISFPQESQSSFSSRVKRELAKTYMDFSLFLVYEPQPFPFSCLKLLWKTHQEDAFVHFRMLLNQEMKWKSNSCSMFSGAFYLMFWEIVVCFVTNSVLCKSQTRYKYLMCFIDINRLCWII